MTLSFRLIARLFTVAAACLANAGAYAQPQEPPPSYPFAQSRPIPGRYIVVFKDSVPDSAAEASNALRAGGQLHYTYRTALKGFAATLPDAALQGILNNPFVAYVEPDQSVSLSGTESPATWGLDRIDQRDQPLNTVYNYAHTGKGVNVFIIDTGIRPDHVEFNNPNRLIAGFTAIADGRGTNDCNGHGTHVAGTVGGTVWGVAKEVKLSPVRVLDCRGSGTFSGVIAGIEWVSEHGPRPAVANMSLGGGKSTAVNSAVAAAVSSGVTMVVAAGNSSADACNYSPSSEPSAITVGATTSSDARSYYSNYGSCVDVFAPGSSITSAWSTANNATNTISGTSMASPHVAGVAALAVEANPAASPEAIAAFIAQGATPNKIAASSVGTGSPNLLLYSLSDKPATEPAKAAISVLDITGSAGKSGKNWRARATVTVRGATSGVTVSGSFLPGGAASCVTGTNASCTLTSASILGTVPQTNFTIEGLSGYNMTYTGQNVKSSVVINKP